MVPYFRLPSRKMDTKLRESDFALLLMVCIRILFNVILDWDHRLTGIFIQELRSCPVVFIYMCVCLCVCVSSVNATPVERSFLLTQTVQWKTDYHDRFKFRFRHWARCF